MNNLDKARINYLEKEDFYSKFATRSDEAIRLKDTKEDFRTAYFRDIDRIIHSLSYTRYADKTQVYSFKENDHISKRMTHVQLVSKIARTIGRALRLNEDLIEAIALGHDLGHTPLGHTGEAILNEISKEELNEFFAHNIQGVRECMEVDRDGNGLNLTIQTLDGIMCHNGEILDPIYKPMKKDTQEFLREYYESYKDLEKNKKYSPMTLEGCVVRISDVIGYIGRDIEDAINLGLFNRNDLPKQITEVLGDNNKDIVNTIILDIVNESMNKPYIKMSEEVFKALFELKKFNYKNIYSKSMTDEEYEYYRVGMKTIYKNYLDAIENDNKENIIFDIFLNYQSKEYLENTNSKRKVIDFISGMTDELFLSQVVEITKK
ncbi:MAG: HD domain-containing protein [Bacilli bacterium]|nr:HD domain-containing protein [Bacilli bacterium]